VYTASGVEVKQTEVSRDGESRNLFLLTSGNAVSMIGSGVYLVVIVLYLKEMTNSPVILGLFNVLAVLPMVLLGPFAGAIVDRVSRKRVVILTDLLRAVIMAGLAAAALALPWLPVPIVLLATIAISLCNAFFMPALQAIIPELVSRATVRRANSLRAASSTSGNLVGNALGGIAYSVLGLPLVLLVNAFSFALSAWEERYLKAIPHEREKNAEPAGIRSIMAEAAAGLVSVWASPGVRLLVVMNATVYALSPPLVLSLPFIVEDILHLPAAYVGYYLATLLGGGILFFLIAGRVALNPDGERMIFLGAPLLLSLAMVVTALFLQPAILFVTFFLSGGAVAVMNLVVNTTLHRNVNAGSHGRVFSVLESVSGAGLPLSYGASGLLLELVLPDVSILFFGVSILLISITVVAGMSTHLKALFHTSSGFADAACQD